MELSKSVCMIVRGRLSFSFTHTHAHKQQQKTETGQTQMIRTSVGIDIDGGKTITGGESKLTAKDVMRIPGVSISDRKRFRRLNGADATLVSDAEVALGKMMGEILNFKETQMQFKAEAPISTDMFLFPIDYNFLFEAPLSCGFLYTSQYVVFELVTHFNMYFVVRSNSL